MFLGMKRIRALYTLRSSRIVPRVVVYRDMDAEVEVQKERSKVMKAVFPDTADFEQGDKKRWELITEHWDEKLIEVPLE
jgi:hypothetical protein